jgi:ABC-type multidrug transport system ATPase subunit
MNSYLQFQQLEKRYGAVTALAQIDLVMDRGSVIALLGPNGAGKSTLFGCLLGFTQPTAGKILFEGHSIDENSRACFGYVSERVALYPHRSIWENGGFFAKIKGHTETEFEHQLKRVGLYHVRERKVRQLSKGMLQRLGLAIALCGQPDLLVLDEPFNGLDPALLETLQNILHEENKRGATLLVSTHTMSAIEPLATHVAILLSGQLAAFQTIEEMRRLHGGRSLEEVYHQIARSKQTPVHEVCV